MKTVLKVILGLFLIIGLGVGAVFFFTRGLVDVGDDYFAAVAQGETADAFAMTASAFQAEITEQAMLDYLSGYNLTEVVSASWSSRSISGGKGSLSGMLQTSEKGAVPVDLTMVKEEGQWRILSVVATSAALGDVATKRPGVPAERDQIVLVSGVTSAFVRSIAQGDMQPLYEHISELWKSQTTAEELAEIFNSFNRFGDGMLILESAPPQFDGPAEMGADGIMVISGRYVTGADTTTFTYKYIYEGLGWKLIGLNLQLAPAEQQTSTTDTGTESG